MFIVCSVFCIIDPVLYYFIPVYGNKNIKTKKVGVIHCKNVLERLVIKLFKKLSLNMLFRKKYPVLCY